MWLWVKCTDVVVATGKLRGKSAGETQVLIAVANTDTNFSNPYPNFTKPFLPTFLHFFGSSVIAGHALPPVTARKLPLLGAIV